MKKKIIIFSVAIFFIIATIVICTQKGQEDIANEENYNEENKLQINENVTEDILGSLLIEKIGLNAPIKNGSENNILKEYIGHIEETSYYDGNVGLAAHNRGNEYSYFARLHELQEGDTVLYKTAYGTRTYKVDTIKIILETDWTLLKNTNENKITMITCISNRPTQRLCVQATEVK